MLYRDLLPIFSERPIFKAPEAERILREQYSIAAPTPVIQEIYYGLAGYDRFQELYGDLNIDQIEWKLIELPTKNFLTIGDNATYPDFLHEVVEDFTTRKGDVFMDDEKHAVYVSDQVCELTYKEYELLKLLMSNAGIVTARDTIMERIWGIDFEGESRTLDMHIKTLRKKLGEAGSMIKTVRNVGYIMSDKEN